MTALLMILLVAITAVFSACAQQTSPPNRTAGDNMATQVTAMEVSSPAFQDGGRIPAKYTADGDDMSPPLNWSPAPGVSEYALICDDPDAPSGVFTHWVIYNLPSGYTGLPEGVSQEQDLPDGSMQGVNSMGKIGYNGPAPPPGKPHHYNFTVYALDVKMDLPPGITKNELLTAMKGHIISQGKLTGLYGR